MVDPDAPTPQNRSLSQVRHFIGGDFSVSDIDNSTCIAKLTNSSVAVSEYLSPGPPPGSDPHRYTILVYLQPQNANFVQVASELVNSTTPVVGFNLSSFAAALSLGDPIAGTFFMTGPDGVAGNTSGSGAGNIKNSEVPAACARGTLLTMCFSLLILYLGVL
jgi:phosphatidylethanolamine-binding protein